MPLALRPPPVSRAVRRSVLAWLGLVVGLSGCVVRQYQPLSTLQRPVIVDPTLPNFADLDITVHCVPGELLTRSRAGVLCDKVGLLFEAQGANVTTIDTEGRFAERFGDAPEGGETDETPRHDLILELRARKTHSSNRLFSWAAWAASFSVFPGVWESSFAQDVVIRDGSGFLLATHTLEGRLVTRYGLGHALLVRLADVGRARDKRVMDSLGRELSEDMYTQLSQLMLNAKLHWSVLQAASAEEAP